MRRLIVHGGAGRIPPENAPTALGGMERALEAGWSRIDDATEAAVAAVRWMEDSGQFNCGRGAVLNLRGRVELDAALATSRGEVGAVCHLTRTPQAIAVAQRVMEESPHVLLAGDGADRFARAMGFAQERMGLPRRRQLYRELRAELERRPGRKGAWSDGRPAHHPAWWGRLQKLVREHPELMHGTVGAVALDGRGRLAAATSTGGIFLKMEGRVSDSALFGCGTYADRDLGVSVTGIGEVIIRHTFARSLAERYRQRPRSLQAAVDATVAALPHDTVGVISLDRKGRFGLGRNTENLAFGHRSEASSSVRVGLQ